MKTTIVIPTYNNHQNENKVDLYLKNCLSQIVDKTDLDQIEVIVVANGCTHKTKELLEEYYAKYKFKFLWSNEPLGYTKASNLGAKAASKDSEFILFLNDDAWPLNYGEKNYWLDELIKLLNDESAVIAGVHALDLFGYNFVVGYCMLVKRWFLEQHGYLNEIFNPGCGEDVEICIRAQKLGFKINTIDKENILSDCGEFYTGDYPFYHKGEATTDTMENKMNPIKIRNFEILKVMFGGQNA